jgi:hypothetical protein
MGSGAQGMETSSGLSIGLVYDEIQVSPGDKAYSPGFDKLNHIIFN